MKKGDLYGYDYNFYSDHLYNFITREFKEAIRYNEIYKGHTSISDSIYKTVFNEYMYAYSDIFREFKLNK